MADILGRLVGGIGGGGTIGAAVVSLRLDADDYQRQLATAKGETQAGANSMASATSKFSGLAKAAFLGVGVAAVAGIGLAIKAGSDLNEQLNKSRVVFGDASKAVIDFSKTAATSLGIAQSEALEAAGNFGSMFDAAGFAGQAAADMSVKMVKLSADLGSFNNIPVAEALEKIRSGLAGEAEPLRQLGVFLSEARVQTEAYASGIAKQGAELTDAEKIQARYNLILQDTTKAQDDFGRTVGESLPNQIKVLKAEVTDVAANLGIVLLPVVLDVAKAFHVIVPVLKFAAENLDLFLFTALGFAAVKFLPGLLNDIAVAAVRMTAAMGASLTAQVGISSFFATIAAAAPPLIAGLIGIGYAVKQMGDIAAETDVKVQGLTDSLIEGKIGVDAYRDSVVAAEVGTGVFAGRLPKVTQEANAVADAGIAAAEAMTRVAMSESFAAARADDLAHSHEVAGKAVRNFARMTDDELDKWSEETKQSLRDATLALRDFTTESGVTENDVVHAFRFMKQEARQLSQAFLEMSREHWINDRFVQFISEQAPEWITAFADLSTEKQKKVQADFLETTRFTDKTNQSFETMIGTLDKLDKGSSKHDVFIEYHYVGFDPSKPGMAGTSTGHGGQQ